MGRGLALYAAASVLVPLVFAGVAWVRRQNFFMFCLDLSLNKLFHMVCSSSPPFTTPSGQWVGSLICAYKGIMVVVNFLCVFCRCV